MRTVQCYIFTSTFIISFLLWNVKLYANQQDTIAWEQAIREAKNLYYQSPAQGINQLKKTYDATIEKKDTIGRITLLMELADFYGHQANYKEAYDKLWKALFLVEKVKAPILKSEILIAIGRHYSFYNRRKKALQYFERSLQIKKQLKAEDKLTNASLVENYYAYCSTFRELNEPELAQQYLDSCYLFYNEALSNPNMAYLKFEKANILRLKSQTTEALTTFKEIIPWFEENAPRYQVLVYTYMGWLYKDIENYKESEWCYKKAIEISKTYKSHIDFTPLVYKKLANLYSAKGELKKTLEQLHISDSLNTIFFDSRSTNNLPLLEIQDAFRSQQEAQEKLIQEQRLAQLEHQESVSFLQRILFIGLIAFLLMIGILFFQYLRVQHRAEKELIKKKRELEITNANEMVELKKRELAASALKLIEKDEFINALKDKLLQGKDSLTAFEVKKIVRSISNNNEKNWKEFETRFIDVNRDFYERLKDKFPKLTQNDLKLCALVKLNFSSKDMAKLLGLSVESIHTTRYRLRKKLNLTRDVNLTEFIADI